MIIKVIINLIKEENIMNAKTNTQENQAVKENEDQSLKTVNVNGVSVSPETKIEYVKENPKRKNSKAHERFAKYMKAKTIEEFFKLGGTPGIAASFTSRKPSSGTMIEPIRPLEYGCKGSKTASSAWAFSTICPAYITMISSVTL